MDILKLNKTTKIMLWTFLTVFISCAEKPILLYKSSDCKLYVAAKQGFWVKVYSAGLKVNDVEFQFKKRRIIPQKTQIGIDCINFFIDMDLKLKDTLSLSYKKKDYKIYHFTNSEDTAIDGANHEKIGICRVSTAKINGINIQDVNNNVLEVNFDIKKP